MNDSISNFRIPQDLSRCRGWECQFSGAKREVAIHEAREHVAQWFFCYECKDTDFANVDLQTFTSWATLKGHLNLHYQSRLFRCKRNDCRKAFFDSPSASRCKHKPSARRTPQLNIAAPPISFKRSEARRRLVMNRTLLEHAERLRVDPSELVNDPEYPVWEEITNPCGKTSMARRVKPSTDATASQNLPIRYGASLRSSKSSIARQSTKALDNSLGNFDGLSVLSVYGLQGQLNAVIDSDTSGSSPHSSSSTFAASPSTSGTDRLGSSEIFDADVSDPLPTYPPYHSGVVHPSTQVNVYHPLPSHFTNDSTPDQELYQLDPNLLGRANLPRNHPSPSPVALFPGPDPLSTFPAWFLEMCSSNPELAVELPQEGWTPKSAAGDGAALESVLFRM